MKTYTGTITKDVVNSFYLEDVLLAHPEIKETYITQVCDEMNMPFLSLIFGYGRAITDTQLAANKSYIADRRLQWAIQARIRNLATFTSQPSAGQGANNANITIILDEEWLSAGMVLSAQDGEGSWQNLLITAANGASGNGHNGNAGGYSYTCHLLTHDETETFDVSFISEGTTIGWTYSANALCGETSTLTPFKAMDWYTNFTTLIKQHTVICKDAMQQALWIMEGDNGTKCFQPLEEKQAFYQFLQSMEAAVVYGTRSYTAVDTVLATNSGGEDVPTGDGILAQITGGNVISWVIDDYTGGTAADYANFRNMVKDEIIAWSMDAGVTEGAELHCYAGISAYAYWNDALVDFVIQGHACCLADYTTGNKIEVGKETTAFRFAGFVINLHKISTFNNKGIQSALYASTQNPLESWRFLIMPESNCDGQPLLQCYFRGGCGTQSAYVHPIVVGTVDPRDPGNPNVTGSSFDRGYKSGYETEFVVIVSDPQKILNFSPAQTAAS